MLKIAWFDFRIVQNTGIAFKKARSGSFSIMFCDHILSIKVVLVVSETANI